MVYPVDSAPVHESDRAIGAAPPRPERGLWHHPDFLRLWAAQTVSLCGTQVTALALPSLAILVLRASPLEVGVLAALPWIAFPVVGLAVGVAVDRLPRRRLMVVADLGRMLALGSAPVAFALGLRAMAYLYAVAAVVGLLTVVFEVAYQSYLPTLVARGSLVEGNAKLALGEGAAQVAGPALGGLLIGAVGAATALTADALSYAASALCLGMIAASDGPPVAATGVRRARIGAEMRDGVGFALRHPVVRALAVASMVQNLGTSIADAVVLIFAYRGLHLTPGAVGLLTAVGSLTFVLAAATVARVTRALGVGRTLFVSTLLGACAYLVLPLGLLGLPWLAVALWRVLFGLHLPSYNVNVISARQAVIPDALQGRVIATTRTVIFGVLALGPLMSGALATAIGPAPTILIGGSIFLVGALPLLARPVIALEGQPLQAAVPDEQTL